MTAASIEVLVHLIDLLSILLRCNAFIVIQKAVVDQRVADHHTVTMTIFFGTRLALGSTLELLLCPTTESVITGYYIKSTFLHTSQYDQEIVHCCCIE